MVAATKKVPVRAKKKVGDLTEGGQRYRDKIKEGLCTVNYCKRKAVPGKRMCKEHATARMEYMRKRTAEQLKSKNPAKSAKPVKTKKAKPSTKPKIAKKKPVKKTVTSPATATV